LQAQMKTLAISGRRPSAGAARPYDTATVPASVAPAGVVNGVRWKRYAGPFPWVPEFRDLTPTAIGSDATFDAAKHAPAGGSSGGSGLFYTGFISVPVEGDYTFFVTSDAGASLHIHDAHVIDDDFNHDGSEVSGTIALAAGYHAYRLCYRHAAAPHVLDVQWSGPGVSKEAIPPGNLFFDPNTDTDTGAGGAGGTGGTGGAGGGGTGGSSGAADSGGGSGGAGGTNPRTIPPPSGCSCDVSPAEQTGVFWLALLYLLARVRGRQKLGSRWYSSHACTCSMRPGSMFS
ncbi:MAG TPA: PA14 domain-containing protein, partial [Polyangia bacterium]|nr:PA14 domain-containing protein [Polyangia bacterium]